MIIVCLQTAILECLLQVMTKSMIILTEFIRLDWAWWTREYVDRTFDVHPLPTMW